jgi:hypothetical protein
MQNSPYLDRPLRTYDEARRDIARRAGYIRRDPITGRDAHYFAAEVYEDGRIMLLNGQTGDLRWTTIEKEFGA